MDLPPTLDSTWFGVTASGLPSGWSLDAITGRITGTATTIEGAGLREVAEECVKRHRDAYGNNPIYRNMLDVGGDYQFRIRGETADGGCVTELAVPPTQLLPVPDGLTSAEAAALPLTLLTAWP